MSQSVRESWGYRCPECGSDTDIDVQALIAVRLQPDNESDTTDARDQSWYWDNKSGASCVCGFGGYLYEFIADEQDEEDEEE